MAVLYTPIAQQLQPTTMGTFADPSQLSQATDQGLANAGYTMGTAAPDLKSQIQAQKAQTAAYNPYYRALMQQGKTFKPDVSGSANWAEGLGKGLSNIYGIQHERSESRKDDASIQQWQDMLSGQQAQAQQGADLLAQQQAANTQHILQRYGPDAAFSYGLSPGKYGEHLAESYANLPTVQDAAHDKAMGTGLGQGDAHRQNITSNSDFMAQNGVPPSAADSGQLMPSQANLYRQVTGEAPVDKLGQQKELYGTAEAKANAEKAIGTAPYAAPQAQADLSKTNIGNQIDAIKAKWANATQDAELRLKQAQLVAMNNSDDKAKRELADAQNQREMLEKVNAAMANGQMPTIQDAVRLDQLNATLGHKTTFASDLKMIANPKAGKALTNDAVQSATGNHGYVTLPSGTQHNPVTGHTIHPNPAPKPAVTMSAIHAAPNLLTNLGDMLHGFFNNGGPIINLGPGQTFNGGY